MSTSAMQVPDYLRDVDIARRRAQARTTPWKHVQAGLLPPPIRFSPGCSRWLRAEVEAVDKARIAGADDKAVRELVKELVAARQQGLAA